MTTLTQIALTSAALCFVGAGGCATNPARSAPAGGDAGAHAAPVIAVLESPDGAGFGFVFPRSLRLREPNPAAQALTDIAFNPDYSLPGRFCAELAAGQNEERGPGRRQLFLVTCATGAIDPERGVTSAEIFGRLVCARRHDADAPPVAGQEARPPYVCRVLDPRQSFTA